MIRTADIVGRSLDPSPKLVGGFVEPAGTGQRGRERAAQRQLAGIDVERAAERHGSFRPTLKRGEGVRQIDPRAPVAGRKPHTLSTPQPTVPRPEPCPPLRRECATRQAPAGCRRPAASQWRAPPEPARHRPALSQASLETARCRVRPARRGGANRRRCRSVRCGSRSGREDAALADRAASDLAFSHCARAIELTFLKGRDGVLKR